METMSSDHANNGPKGIQRLPVCNARSTTTRAPVRNLSNTYGAVQQHISRMYVSFICAYMYIACFCTYSTCFWHISTPTHTCANTDTYSYMPLHIHANKITYTIPIPTYTYLYSPIPTYTYLCIPTYKYLPTFMRRYI